MQGKLLAIIALVLMMLEPLQGIQLTSQTVVGNLLFEQSTVYVLALLMLIAAFVMWSFINIKSFIFLLYLHQIPLIFSLLFWISPTTILNLKLPVTRSRTPKNTVKNLKRCQYLWSKLGNGSNSNQRALGFEVNCLFTIIRIRDNKLRRLWIWILLAG